MVSENFILQKFMMNNTKMQMRKRLEHSISERVSPQNGLYAGGQKMRSDPVIFFVPIYLNPISDAHSKVGTSCPICAP